MFNWLFVGLFFQPFGSSFAWFLWCNLSGTPNTDMTILSAMLPLQLLIPIGHGVCYLNEKLNGVKIFGICAMILSAVMLSCDITSLISGTNNNDTNNTSPQSQQQDRHSQMSQTPTATGKSPNQNNTNDHLIV